MTTTQADKLVGHESDVRLIVANNRYAIVIPVPGTHKPLYVISTTTGAVTFSRYMIDGGIERVMTLPVPKTKIVLKWLPLLLKEAKKDA